MDPNLHEWLDLFIRWFHVVAGITWIGQTYLFNWMEDHLTDPDPERNVAGRLWMVHGGGFYRVERWERGAEATDLYLQVVVVVWRPESDSEPAGARLRNRQLRYYLAGLDEAPFQLANARVQFVTRADPVLGVWQRFELPVRADFERLWGSALPRIGRIELLFEARWDNMPAGSAVRADVYYDDLFAGQDAARPSGVP